MAKYNINDLLNSLGNQDTGEITLPNTAETWSRIGSKDKFNELGLESSELEKFLEEWTEENEYSNI